MKKMLALGVLLLGLLMWPYGAQAHCDAVDGPVATAAVRALEAKNVNLVLPFAPAEAEAEMVAAFDQAVTVRSKGPDAKALADRYFMETAVRLHRAGEHAPYTGLKPAGRDFGPAIPAAEKALNSGTLEPLVSLLNHHVAHGIMAHFERARHAMDTSKEPTTHDGVVAARQRVSAELEFIGYIEGLFQASKGGGHKE